MSRRERVRGDALPDETLPRIRLLVENSAPDADRPKLNEKSEIRLSAIERKSAACYADAEEHTHKLVELSRRMRAIREGEEP